MKFRLARRSVFTSRLRSETSSVENVQASRARRGSDRLVPVFCIGKNTLYACTYNRRPRAASSSSRKLGEGEGERVGVGAPDARAAVPEIELALALSLSELLSSLRLVPLGSIGPDARRSSRGPGSEDQSDEAANRSEAVAEIRTRNATKRLPAGIFLADGCM